MWEDRSRPTIKAIALSCTAPPSNACSKAAGFIPAAVQDQDVLRALQAPHQGDDQPVYPGTCRPGTTHLKPQGDTPVHQINWRFRVNDAETVRFTDGAFGPQTFTAGKDFGDFIVWRHDNLPAYHLAVVVDDAAMRITEVVRGEDLLRSTARQLLLYRALVGRPRCFIIARW